MSLDEATQGSHKVEPQIQFTTNLTIKFKYSQCFLAKSKISRLLIKIHTKSCFICILLGLMSNFCDKLWALCEDIK